jgi:hypothetical protein
VPLRGLEPRTSELSTRHLYLIGLERLVPAM